MSLSSQIKEYCKVKYSSIKVVLDQVEISVEKDNLLKLIQFLKDDPSCLFDQLSDITAVDYPNKKDRFLITPHKEVLEYIQRKASDYDRWISGMQRLQKKFEDFYNKFNLN